MDVIKTIKCGMANCFLITGNEKSVLVDTGPENQGQRVLDTVKDSKVSLIILTHGHIDHIANAGFLSEKLGVPIAMHKGDYDLCKDNLLRPIYADSIVGHIIKKASEASFKGTKIQDFEPTVFLEDNQSLQDYGVDAKVVSLTGHTEGSIGVLVNQSDFIVGDAMMNMFGESPARIYENKELMEKSIEIIRNSGCRKIYVGHGNPIDARQYFS
jgi:glyoxylase-like metal-dependent hydrolase (beta-lactamase superfamily II)